MNLLIDFDFINQLNSLVKGGSPSERRRNQFSRLRRVWMGSPSYEVLKEVVSFMLVINRYYDFLWFSECPVFHMLTYRPHTVIVLETIEVLTKKAGLDCDF